MEAGYKDVRCEICGAPARYDIVKGRYLCAYCGSSVDVVDAKKQKQGFRKIHLQKLKDSASDYELNVAQCSGCGAKIVFEEGEATTNCAFCNRALVRKQYLDTKEFPELIIPFKITRKEAIDRLTKWCNENSNKKEAKALRENVDKLQGFYLPYELIKGPVKCSVSRKDSYGKYTCEGYVDNIFINCSKQLDNHLLDGFEPYKLDELKEFSFSYVAGQRVKVSDIDEKELIRRIDKEIGEDYTPLVRKTLESGNIDIDTNCEAALRMPVLLPVYYLKLGNSAVGVNGQTGKYAILSMDQSYAYFLPWWLKAIIATILITAVAFFGFRIFGMDINQALFISGLLSLITLIITLCAYSDSVRNNFRVLKERKIFSSKDAVSKREGKELIYDKADEKICEAPLFFENIDNRKTQVIYRFTTVSRIIKTALLAMFVLFLPVIIALFLNGFDFERLELGGSAVWFCIMVPVIPIYILKFAIIELYERPLIYIVDEKGKTRRYRKKYKIRLDSEKLKEILSIIFIPPGSLAFWFGILSFMVMCYLTAFGFD